MRQCTVGFALVASIIASMFLAAGAEAANHDSRNAATWYLRAIDRLQRLDARDLQIVEQYREDPSAGPSAELRGVLSRSGPMLELFRRGARQRYSDFELDWSQGFELVLPHIGQLRTIARIAKVDAMVHLHDGDGAGAAARIASIYAAADHLESDRIMISTLVGHAIFRTADEATQMGFDRALFDGASAEVMLRSVRRLDPDDPFGMVEAVAGEQEVAVSWLGDRFGEQENRGEIIGLMDWVDAPPAMADEFEAMTDEEFAGELEAYDRMMDDIVAAFENPDPEAAQEALKEIEKQLMAGEHGMIAQIFTPAFSFVHHRMQEANKEVTVRREMLEAIVKGEAVPEEQANAAWFYAQAIEKLREEPPFPVDELFATALDDRRPVSDRLGARLHAAAEIVDLVRQGSELARCDFSDLRPAGVQRLCPDDLAGMRDLLCLLQVDARRLLATGESGGDMEAIRVAAADRLAISYRVVAHLGTDDAILGPLVAHDAFRRTRAIIDEAFESDAFGEPHRATLHAAADRIARKDPFGYIGSVVAGRQMLEELARKYPAGDDAGKARAEALRDRARIADGEQILHVVVIYDTMIRASNPANADDAPPPDPLARMDGIISRRALDAVRTSVPQVAPLIARGEIDVFHDRDIPTVARFVPRQQKARGDLREGLRRLRPPTPTAESSRDPGPSPAPPTPAERTGSR
jgi:hypothetical protein